MPELQDLFKEFSGTSFQQWKEKAESDLRGKPLTDLEHHTSDGLPIHPYYDRSHSEGIGRPIKTGSGWTMVHEILVEDNRTGNTQALEALKWGASGILFYVHDNVDLTVLLEGVMIEVIRVDWVVEGDLATFCGHLNSLIQTRGLDPSKLRGSINHDPVEIALRTGKWDVNRDSDMSRFNLITSLAPSGYQSVSINGNLYQNAGATSVQQLAFILSQGHEYLLRMEEPDPSRIWLNVAVGSRYFEEIAKLRALRILWANLMNAYDLPQGVPHIYAETSLRNKTLYDPHTNLLRTTTEGMSAVIGGCDSLSIKPFSLPYRTGDDFADRLALNQQLIFEYESYLSRVNDVAGGSYFIEELTSELAEKAWTLFKEIEADGGILNAIGTGRIQSLIRSSARIEQERFDSGELELLGMNLYPNKEEKRAQQVENHWTSPTPADEEVRPVIPRRLAEEMERRRLEEENQTA